MEIELILKLLISLSILNVWLIRKSKATFWRGGEAKSLSEEFAVYGLSSSVMNLVGGMKILFSILLLITAVTTTSFKNLGELISLSGISILMIGAIFMHIKVNDSPIKSLPAFIFLLCSLYLIYINDSLSVII
jgi:hypothetical protein